MTRLPTRRASQLARREPECRWLVEQLWAEDAVGIVGGEPKCCKSFLALDLAVSVAAGTPCLGRFSVRRPGRVLLFAAEDAEHIVRERLAGIALARGTSIAALDVHVITAPTLRIDTAHDRQRLADTVAALAPRLLVLDPFVRLHRIDENSAGEVAPLLAFLRELNREHALAVVLVHHAKKGAAAARAGQALRGSSEFHAWGDSNLYLARRGGALQLSVEQRAASPIAALRIALVAQEDTLALRVVEGTVPDPAARESRPPHERVLTVLRAAQEPLRAAEMRRLCRMRTQTLVQVLGDLVERGSVELTQQGYRVGR